MKGRRVFPLIATFLSFFTAYYAFRADAAISIRGIEHLAGVDTDLIWELPDKTELQNISLGEFKVTAYCACEICCGKSSSNPLYGITATGTTATQGRTIAVDPSIISYGTTVYIDGKEYIAEDTGGGIKGNRIDIYFENHADALDWGIQYKEVWIRKENE